MTPEEAFLQALIESPEDDTTRLIFADWLEEQGDARAAAVRKHPEVSHFLAVLGQARNTRAPLRQLGEWVFGGRADLVRDLGLLLRCQPGQPLPEFRLPGIAASILKRVRQALCPLPDVRKAAAVIRRLGGSPPKPEEIPDLASQLASKHSPDGLLAVLEQYQQDGRFLELLACLAQEMVLRGVILAGVPVAESIAAQLRVSGHPLAQLPLFLTAVEGDLRPWLPRYSRGGQSWATPFGLSQQPREPLSPRTIAAVAFMEMTDIASSHCIRQAVRNWQEQSNGEAEARVFRTNKSIGQNDLSLGLLRLLNLDCLEGASEQEIRAERVTSRDVFATLFSAASAGGAYNRGLRGAYGRLAAWQSLAGLVGGEPEEVEAVAHLASRCLWVRFETGSGWFNQIAWDLGLLAVRPNGRSLAVLAATDTD